MAPAVASLQLMRLQASLAQFPHQAAAASQVPVLSGLPACRCLSFSSPCSSSSPSSSFSSLAIQGRPRGRVVAQAEGDAPGSGIASILSTTQSSGTGNSSCCGGSGKAGGGGCSSKEVDVSGVGKEFEAMVAASTIAEFEKGYVTGEMKGMITRDVVQEVMTIPEATSSANEEKFLDVDQLLNEAMKMSSGDFIFDAELDDMIV